MGIDNPQSLTIIGAVLVATYLGGLTLFALIESPARSMEMSTNVVYILSVILASSGFIRGFPKIMSNKKQS